MEEGDQKLPILKFMDGPSAGAALKKEETGVSHHGLILILKT